MPVQWPYLFFLFFLAVVFFCIFYTKIESFFIFYPDRSSDFSPEDYGLNYQDVYFEAGEGQLHGWFFPIEQGRHVILFCHGNAGNITHRLENVKLLLEKGLQVFIFDYRGYGRSSKGRNSEKEIYEDAGAAYDWLIQEKGIMPGDIILFGRSLGGAAAISLALSRQIKFLIIESVFTSTRDIAKTMPLFFLLSPILPRNYNNLEKIKDIRTPKLIIHGDADEIVPFSMGEALFKAAAGPKCFYRIKGAGHNDTYVVGGEKYFQVINSFVNENLALENENQ